MDTTRRGAQDGNLQSTRDQNELGRGSYTDFFWLIEDHPGNRDEHDLPLSSELWGDYFHTDRPEPWDWETAYADPGPGAEFTVHVPAPTGAGADIFF